MKTWLRRLSLTLIPSLVTFCFGYWGDWRKEAVQQVEYLLKEQSSILRLPDQIKDNVEINYGGKKVNDLSFEYITIANRTNKPLQDSSIFASFSTTASDGGQLVGVTEIVPSKYSKTVEKGIVLEETGKKVIEWHFNALNQSYDSRDWVGLFLVFAGKTPPKITISSNKAGLELVEFDPSKTSLREKLRFCGVAALVILMYAAVIGVPILISTRRDNKREARRKDVISAHLAARFPTLSAEEIEKEYQVIVQLYLQRNKDAVSSSPS